MTKNNEKIKRRYNRISKIYDLLEKPMEAMSTNERREKIIAKIEGFKVLEVGVGTGKNLKYYPENLEVTAIDFSENMLKKAEEKTNNLTHVDLIEMDAQAMTFEENTFDSVITSCVFCSVADPIAGLQEIRRVCKKDGKIIMLEHMRSQNKILGKLMDLVNFIPLYIWGANINRKTLENLKKADFKEEDISYENIWIDIVKLIEIRNKK